MKLRTSLPHVSGDDNERCADQAYLEESEIFGGRLGLMQVSHGQVSTHFDLRYQSLITVGVKFGTNMKIPVFPNPFLICVNPGPTLTG